MKEKATVPVAAGASSAFPLKAQGGARGEGFARLVRGLRRSSKGVIGAAIVAVLAFLAIFGSMIAPYDPLAQDYDALLSPPSPAHLLGTDNLGRDNLSRLLYGARISLQVGVLTVLLAAVIGIVVGFVAAQSRGMVDQVSMRIIDGIMAFPGIIL